MKVTLNKKINDKNEGYAQQNSIFFADSKILCLNMISSPGSGKTTIISRTVTDLKDKFKIGVVEGDIKTDTDARKVRASGAQAVQIETQGSCHLTAEQVSNALEEINTAELNMVIIENVGNLVCPSAFQLGEQYRVVVLSIPEGDDKPVKYPGTFARADVVLINKSDLAEHVDFNMDRAIADIRTVNPNAKIFHISATSGQGMKDWYDWLMTKTS